MGIWSFVKDKGKSLFGGEAHAAEVKTDALNSELKTLGLDNQGVSLAVDGDKVTVQGKPVDAATLEKIILAVGNVEGVGTVEADVAGEPVFYVVKKGDTLSAIAKATLGSASRYPEIFEANKPMLTHPDKIYPGQTLRIPGGKSVAV